MNKTNWLIVIAVIIVVIGAFVYQQHPKNQNQPVAQTNPAPTTPIASTFDPMNATYVVEGQSVTLANGKAEIPAAPGSAIMMTTMIFGRPVSGDLNGDGKADAAVFLAQDSGGSGTFYYAAAAINAPNGAQGTNAILLGDRIAPQTIEIRNGQVVVNYADRKPGQPFSAAPSVGITKYLTYNASILQDLKPTAGPGGHCGGNMTTAAVCPNGSHCAPTPGSHLPFGDVGGTCVPN